MKAQKEKKKFHIEGRYFEFDYNKALIAGILLTLISAYLAFDNFTGEDINIGIGSLASFCTVSMLIASGLLMKLKLGGQRRFALEVCACAMISVVFWITHGWFLYTGGTGGTSIFLIFSSAPVAFFFFNLVYGTVFCAVEFIGMTIYMSTPLHLYGYAFPEMYYGRLPMMYLFEIVFCALAQYETVKARTLQDEALLEARKANEAKTDFLANTSHEIRTPMNSILGYCELILRQDQLGARTREYALGIRDSGRNLLYIINDILDISKIEANKLEIIQEDFETASLMNDIITITRARIGDKPLEFLPSASEELPNILHGDVGRIRQIIINLVSNAVKYTPEGKVILEFSLERGSRNLLTARVEDTGIGIRPEDLSHIFNSFEQVDTKRNRSIEGTGLGLAISRRLAELMGGDITVTSEYGVGSVFTMRVPVTIVDDSPMVYPGLSGDPSGTGYVKASASSSVSFTGSFTAPEARILIVDDNPVNLHVACGLMEVYRMHIQTVESGYEALDLTEDTRFDLIFMDHMMPKMDGVETVQKLRGSEKNFNRNTPVVALTANAISGMKEMFLENGFQDYLSKPMELRELDRILRTYLPQEKVLPGESKQVRSDDALCGEARTALLASSLIDENTALTYGIEEKKLALFDFSYEKTREELTSAWQEKDWETLQIKSHGLKSASLFIGAVHLSRLSKDAEAASAQKDADFFSAHFEELLREYDNVHLLIGEVLKIQEQKRTDAETAGEELTPITEAELREKLGEIREALELYDAVTASETAGELKECSFGSLPLKEKMCELSTLIDLFSYEEAGSLLEQIERDLTHTEKTYEKS